MSLESYTNDSLNLLLKEGEDSPQVLAPIIAHDLECRYDLSEGELDLSQPQRAEALAESFNKTNSNTASTLMGLIVGTLGVVATHDEYPALAIAITVACGAVIAAYRYSTSSIRHELTAPGVKHPA